MEKQNLKIQPDAALIGAYRNGSRAALNVLLTRYYSPVLTFITRMTGNRDVSVDITQDVFTRVVHDLANYKDKDNFQGWLYRIARNAVIDWSRKRKTRLKYSGPDTDNMDQEIEKVQGVVQTPLQELEQQERRDLIINAVTTLPPKLREVYLMREHGGMTFNEIATICNCSVNTVLGRMRYAMQHLREQLQQNLGVEVNDVL